MTETVKKFVGNLEIEIKLNEETGKYVIQNPFSKLLVEGSSADEVFQKYVELMRLGQ